MTICCKFCTYSYTFSFSYVVIYRYISCTSKRFKDSWCPPVAMGICFSVQISLFCYVLTTFFRSKFPQIPPLSLRAHSLFTLAWGVVIWPPPPPQKKKKKKKKKKIQKVFFFKFSFRYTFDSFHDRDDNSFLEGSIVAVFGRRRMLYVIMLCVIIL